MFFSMFSANVHFHGLKISLRFETILANIGKLVHMGVFHMGKDFLFGTFSKATLGAFPKARVMPIGLLDYQLVHSPSMLLIETFHMICSKGKTVGLMSAKNLGHFGLALMHSTGVHTESIERFKGSGAVLA